MVAANYQGIATKFAATLKQTIMWAEIVAPIRDAVSLIDHQKSNLYGSTSQNLSAKPFVSQPLR